MTSTTTTRQAPATGTALAGTRWSIDPVHSSVEFGVRHMMLATVRGRFAEFAGTARFERDDLASGMVDVAIEAGSIDTRSEQRDQHLRSADFFDVEQHPELRFTSRRIEHVRGDHYRVTGDLSMRGVTREVVLDATFTGSGTDPWGNARLAFSAETRVDRREWGLTWNQALEAGGILVGDEIRISIDVQLVAQQPAGDAS